MLFLCDRAKQEACHVCGSSRWDENNGTLTEKGCKEKPAKILRYFPLIPRLQRLFATEKTSTDMRWHDEGRTKDGLLRCPADGKAWNDFDDRYPDFADDSCNTRLGLASDGFNPFGNMSSKHSTWPVMIIPYNLPPWICMKHTSLMLSMIIPGPNSPGNDVDVYLQPLIEELKQLWKGVKTMDATSKKSFPLRAALLWTLNDFPALAYLYGCSTSGTYACPSCAGSTKSKSLKKIKKLCYMGHRRCLPQGHPYRREKKFFYEKEDESAPEPLDGSSVLKMLEGRVFVHGKKDVSKQTKKGKQGNSKSEAKDNGGKNKRKRATREKQLTSNLPKKEKRPEDWLKKRSIFFQLQYWEHNLLRHNLDMMHIEKNVCERLIRTLLHIVSKTDTNLNARLYLVDMAIRPDLHPKFDYQGKPHLPDATFTMSREKKGDSLLHHTKHENP
nr:uncharacterized protein LOC117860169 [Setaria viridis]XP_034599302.1 uncharacterized protein LOC117860169 [Setaria viridis]XP_034599303.1 uncharacterized protein LOC117860169 [Setaria viridis]XP_034599304.1 uncharacterized protein LOC117860169 [Setaria viridis]XP_034599305.1 uncharacterized protein LOC117860169 [Setaria viridis]XP_034599306.1 uncharacterized protein LOC117860169 [Setaria viridis]XP_034599307.1 uncharacterized protein LOC117860169 [Setaria viridis]XP_034599309.1 uncharacte